MTDKPEPSAYAIYRDGVIETFDNTPLTPADMKAGFTAIPLYAHPPSQPDASDIDAWEQVGFWREKAQQAEANLKELNEKYLPRYAAVVAANRVQPDASALVEALRFYADREQYAYCKVMQGRLIEDDAGDTARAALSAWEAQHG